MRRPGPRAQVGLALLVALLLRLAFAFGYWQGKPLTHDEQEYLAIASNLAGGRGFSRDLPGAPEGAAVDRFARAPLYPVMLAALFVVTRHDTGRLPDSVPAPVKAAQSVAGVVGAWVIGAIARRAAGTRAGVAATWIAAVHPALVWSCAYALSEAVYSPMILASALRLGDAIDGRTTTMAPTPATSRTRAVVAGLLAGAAALVRSSALVTVPVACLWMLFARRSATALLFAAAAAAVVLPWTIRNYQTYGRVIVVAADGGVTFWTGNHPLSPGEGDLAANPDLKRAQRVFVARHGGMDAERLEPLYYRDALATIAAHPLWWLGLLAKKLFHLVVPIGPSYRLHSPPYFWGSVIPYVVLLAGAVAGARRIVRWPRPPVALLLYAGSAVIVCLVFFPQERFRIPVIDPTLVVLTAGTIALRHDERSSS